MNNINIFLEHIYEACSQRGITQEKMLTEARDMGYTGLECDLWRLSGGDVRAMFQRCGMNIASVYAHFDFAHESNELSAEKMKFCLDTAAYFGADKVLAIPGFIRQGENHTDVCGRICEGLSEMCTLACSYGITVMLEDFDDISAPYSTAAGLEYFMRNTDGLKYAFDTGNFAYSLESADKAYDILRQWIVHSHLKDRSRDVSRISADGGNAKADLGGDMMYPCETGGGYIGVETLVKRMLHDGYTGDFSVEHFGAVNQTVYMKRSIENIKKWIKEAQL